MFSQSGGSTDKLSTLSTVKGYRLKVKHSLEPLIVNLGKLRFAERSIV